MINAYAPLFETDSSITFKKQKILYLGNTIIIPEVILRMFNYIATDSDGFTHMYKSKPKLEHNPSLDGGWWATNDESYYLGEVICRLLMFDTPLKHRNFFLEYSQSCLEIKDLIIE